MVMVRSITVSQILKRWCNSHNIDDIRDGNVPSKEEQLLDGRELKVQHRTRTSCVGGKAIKWSMIIQFIEARMVFLIMSSIDNLEELIRLMMITTHLSRDFMKT